MSSSTASSGSTNSTKDSVDTAIATAAPSNSGGGGGGTGGGSTSTNATNASSGIRFSEYKTSGVTLRSQRIKLPSSVGQKKTKAIESMLTELGIDVNPIPTEEIGEHFNDLRSDMVLLYELKSAVSNLEFELQTLRLRHQASIGGGGGAGGGGGIAGMDVPSEDEKMEGNSFTEDITDKVEVKREDDVKEEVEDEESKECGGGVGGGGEDSRGNVGSGGGGGGSSTPKPTKKLSEVIDVQTQNQKKRKAALEQKNVLSKLKNR